MIDFLRANPYVSREEYMWKWTIPQIQLARYDYSHVEYLSEQQAKEINKQRNTKVVENPNDIASALNIPIFNNPQ